MLFVCRGKGQPTFIDPRKKKEKKKIIRLSAKISNEIALILSKHLRNKKAAHFLLLYQWKYIKTVYS